jgi:hypothetical protein
MDKSIKNPFNECVDDLHKAIDEYKRIHLGYISPEYKRQFVGNFKSYLKALDKIDMETALKYVDLGIKFSKAFCDSFGKQESTSILFSLEREVYKELNISDIEETDIQTAIDTKEPDKFFHNPGVDANHTKNAQRGWYEFVQLNKHQIAKLYVTRSQRKFSKDEVMNKYHLEREKKLGLEKAHQNTIEWLKSYGKSIDQVYEEIGIQVHDKDSFNKEYNRWKKKLGTELS